MIIKKILKIICLILINNFLSTTRFFSLKRTLLTLSGLSIGKNTKVVGPISIGTCATLIIGDNCWIGKNLSVHGNGTVNIGNNCDLAPDVTFVTGSHEIGEEDRRAGLGIAFDIKVEDGCWIGVKSTIVGNTVIGKGVIIGACSLVNKNVVPNVVIAGVPARELKKL